ncbi:MAG: dihydrofolate reductase [Psychroflexus halocasei]|uniref:dihydrofolate reductase n=1 Tax=Psychroflexus sp. S27 TaxID=1982757 RepID=UPI000C29DB13|nr:dihydrofolate reductase [Psychroflexus sp. S27]PJX22889.1 diacylglycerol kinase [Psychroflexus sp. S27]
MTKLISIAAIAENNAIGKDNTLMWHLPNDFKHFKKTTSGHYIIMGRKTFESFPKPLPNRTHVIITRQEDYQTDDSHIVVDSLEKAINAVPTQEEKAYIIGGGEIYKQAMEKVDELEITRVHADFDDAETFFPEISDQKWKVIKEEFHAKDEKHDYAFTYQTFKRV